MTKSHKRVSGSCRPQPAQGQQNCVNSQLGISQHCQEFAIVHVRGVLGNKCAGKHNLKTVHFRETFASSNFLAWSSAICVFFYSPLPTLGRRRQAFM
jgi:hypothetical protein